MSLLNLIDQSVVIKFTGVAKYDPATGYVFRLTGVDGMGFLQLQDLRVGPDDEHETIDEPYWINKDIVQEIHEYASAIGKDKFKFSAEPAAKPQAAKLPVDGYKPAFAKPARKPKKAGAL